MAKTHVEQYVEDPRRMRSFQQERAILSITSLIEAVMEQEGVSRAELAKRLGRSRGWVTQLLDGEANKTVRTIADILAVLGREFRPTALRISLGRHAQAKKTKGVNSAQGRWYPARDIVAEEDAEKQKRATK